jgi:hypothetical protein
MSSGQQAGFQPSPISYITTAVLDRGQYTQPAGSTTQVGMRRPDRRNPLYQASAEAITSMAHFMAHRRLDARESMRDYEVLPGGESVYFNEAAVERLVPFGPADWPPNYGARRTMPLDVAMQYRITRPPKSSAALSFPDDRDAYGHYSRVSEKLKGRQGANTY